MTVVYLTRKVTDPDGKDVELELAAEVSVDGELIAVGEVDILAAQSGLQAVTSIGMRPLPAWAVDQIDMTELMWDVHRRLKAREKGWP